MFLDISPQFWDISPQFWDIAPQLRNERHNKKTQFNNDLVKATKEVLHRFRERAKFLELMITYCHYQLKT